MGAEITATQSRSAGAAGWLISTATLAHDWIMISASTPRTVVAKA